MPLGFNYSSGMTVYIYGLYDPRNGYLRYIGKAINLKVRLALHLSETKNTHKNQWLAQLKSLRLVPEMRVLETIENSDDLDWQERERWWIKCARESGEAGPRIIRRTPRGTIRRAKTSLGAKKYLAS